MHTTIKDQIDQLAILDIANHLLINCRRKGNTPNYQCLCFKHKDTHPSLVLNSSMNIWKCFACGAGGGRVQLVMEHEGMSYREACEWLANEFNLTNPIKKQQNMWNSLKEKLTGTHNDLYLDADILNRMNDESSTFSRALADTHILTYDQVCQARQRFNLQSPNGQEVIFWQIDDEGQIHDGKIMAFRADAHRNKDQHPMWVGDLMRRNGMLAEDWHSSKCLFGLHQLQGVPLTEPLIVAVVESEKTAVICSQLVPSLDDTPVLWMATGGLSMLNTAMLRPLKGRRVILFPDTDTTGRTYHQWIDRAQQAQQQLDHIYTVSDLLEEYASPSQKERKIDIADYIVES